MGAAVMAIPAGALGNAFSEVVEKELNEDLSKAKHEKRKHDDMTWLLGSFWLPESFANIFPYFGFTWDSSFGSVAGSSRGRGRYRGPDSEATQGVTKTRCATVKLPGLVTAGWTSKLHSARWELTLFVASMVKERPWPASRDQRNDGVYDIFVWLLWRRYSKWLWEHNMYGSNDIAIDIYV